MTIIKKTFGLLGQDGVFPRRCQMQTTDNLEVITVPGYITQASIFPDLCYPSDIFDITYSFDETTNIGIYGEFTCTIADGGIITLIPAGSSVTLPVVVDDFAQFSSTSGDLKDTGKVPSDNLQNSVVMYKPQVLQPTPTGFTPGYVDNNGTVGVIAGNQYFMGSVVAGIPSAGGLGGDLISYPSEDNNGYLRLSATPSFGDFHLEITNAPITQDTVYTIPNPGTADANICVSNATIPTANLIIGGVNDGIISDAGFRIVQNISPEFPGGDIVFKFPAGVNPGDNVVCTLTSSTNNVSITTVLVDSNQITVTFSADPGPNTYVTWIGFINA